MQGKYKCKTGVKSVKKVKKYDEGTNSVSSDVLGQIGGTVGGLGAMGIEALTKSKYDGRYTSQLKDENQAVGRAIGAGAGQALNLVVPGLGSLAAPILSSAGGAIQRGFQKGKLEGLKREGEYQDRVAKVNENVQQDLTSFQAKQYSKGTKVIEIEGKKTPEIHTDKNFNLKNLGTTPHSKGGNKVVAEEGDVVFPTQNSPKKYNEIMSAIMKKDKYKLKKEQSKLPEDKATKAKYGMQVSGDNEYDWNKTAGHNLRVLDSDTRDASKYLRGKIHKGLATPFMPTAPFVPEYKSSAPSSGPLAPAPVSIYAPLKEKKLNAAGWIPNGGLGKATPKAKSKGTAKGGKSNWKNPNAPMTLAQTPDNLSKISGPIGEAPVLPTKIETAKVETPQGTGDKQKKGLGFDGNNLMELAPIAYNLGQGLFGNVEKVKRKEYNPQLEQYVDTSNNMRREVNQNYKMAQSDARNLSGGLASNVRANSQAAANQKLSQMNQIDSQEYGKQLDVNNRNVDRINDGKKINIDLFNNYEDLDAQNRAVKQNALSTGLEQMSELGSRNKLQKNLLSNQLASAKLLAGGNYETPINEEGQAEEGVLFKGAKTNPINYSSLGVFAPKKPKTHAKGSKSIQVERKYKLK